MMMTLDELETGLKKKKKEIDDIEKK